MAVSILQNALKIGQVAYDVGGVAILSGPDAGWYYTEIDVSASIPVGAMLVSVALATFTASVSADAGIRGSTSYVILRCPVQYAMPQNRTLFLFYAY